MLSDLIHISIHLRRKEPYMITLIIVSSIALLVAWICVHYWAKWHYYTAYESKYPKWIIRAHILLSVGALVSCLASAVCLTLIAIQFRNNYISGGIVTIAAPTWQFFLCIFSILVLVICTGLLTLDAYWSVSRTWVSINDPDFRWRIKKRIARLQVSA